MEAPAPTWAATTGLCINCLDCIAVCPAGLLPHYLYHFALAEQLGPLDTYRAPDCTSCGACSAVCPTGLPLSQQIAAARARLGSDPAPTPATPPPPPAPATGVGGPEPARG